MSADFSEIASYVSFAMAVITFIYTRFKAEAQTNEKVSLLKQRSDEYKADIASLKEKLDKLCEDVREIRVKNELIWGAVEKAMVDLLHHPTEPERDNLLEKLRDKTITLQEMEMLEKMLEEAITEKKGQPESIAATLLLALVRQKIYDNMNKLSILKGCLP